MILLRLLINDRARRLGRYPIFCEKFFTLSLVSTEMSVPSLSAFEMVAGVTDKALAMSLMVSLLFV